MVDIASRTLRLVEEALREPFNGTAKPEPLRGQLSGKCSRRLDYEHRVVFQVSVETCLKPT